MNIILDPGAFMPEFAHKTDAGADLRSPVESVVPAHGSVVIDTGVHVEIPEGYVGMLKSKSGLNVKHNLIGEGVCDSGYTGSIRVKLYNLGDTDYQILRGDKIIQMVILPCAYCEFTQVEKFAETEDMLMDIIRKGKIGGGETMYKTKISWCDSTWNPVVGCLHGCEYCYARGIANRFGTLNKGDILPEDEGLEFVPDTPETFLVLDKPVRNENGKIEPYPSNFYPTFHKYRLNEYQNKKGRNIFVCSMADLFGDWVPDEWIEEVFRACDNAPQHNYLFLTKNPFRYELLHQKGILRKQDNMWYGYSMPKNGCDYWYDSQYKTFESMEPLLEMVAVPHSKWTIIGAETGRRKNKVVPERKWIDHIVNKCREGNIPVFMKSSLADIWGEPLIQEFPEELKRK